MKMTPCVDSTGVHPSSRYWLDVEVADLVGHAVPCRHADRAVERDQGRAGPSRAALTRSSCENSGHGHADVVVASSADRGRAGSRTSPGLLVKSKNPPSRPPVRRRPCLRSAHEILVVGRRCGVPHQRKGLVEHQGLVARRGVPRRDPHGGLGPQGSLRRDYTRETAGTCATSDPGGAWATTRCSASSAPDSITSGPRHREGDGHEGGLAQGGHRPNLSSAFSP